MARPRRRCERCFAMSPMRISPIEWGRWLLWAIVLLIAANFAWIVARNENFGWPIVAQWFTAHSILTGL